MVRLILSLLSAVLLAASLSASASAADGGLYGSSEFQYQLRLAQVVNGAKRQARWQPWETTIGAEGNNRPVYQSGPWAGQTAPYALLVETGGQIGGLDWCAYFATAMLWQQRLDAFLYLPPRPYRMKTWLMTNEGYQEHKKETGDTYPFYLPALPTRVHELWRWGQANKRIRKLAKPGYLVFNRRAVVASPIITDHVGIITAVDRRGRATKMISGNSGLGRVEETRINTPILGYLAP